jgi:mRNA-degrading endonuclease toxin of MazEF toxin-antitoxin module
MNPRRGELYRLKRDDLGKQRPIVIVSNATLNGGHNVVAVPFYSQQLAKRAKQPWCAIYSAGEGGLEMDSAAKTDEITLVDKLHIDLASGPIGKFTDEQMDRLAAALKWSLDIV